jgi:predicted ATP-grasp superfamily ATP-dependent carboligase
LNMRPPRRILVLGSDGRSTLTIVRSLGRADMEVDLAWCLPGDPPAKSRYVTRRYDIPVPTADERWLDALKALLAERRHDVVIPSSDLELIPLILARRELEPFARLAIPSDEVFELTFHKSRTAALAERIGLPMPHWRELGSGALRLPEEIAIPCVLNPCPRSTFAGPLRPSGTCAMPFPVSTPTNWSPRC